MKSIAAALLCAWTSLALAQDPARGRSQLEHVPPDPPQSHVDHDMSYREMAQMMGMDDRRRFGKVMVDRLEWHDGDDGSQYAWEARAWYGGDYHKAWLEAEGERVEDSAHESRIEGGWDRIISPWWSARVGLRHDAGEGQARDWLGAGVAGLAPGFIESEAMIYFGEDGRTAVRFKFERDFLFTQRVVLQPEFEVDAFGKDDPENLIGSGLSSLKFGLRLRYEIRREFAPYIGAHWAGHFGDTSDLRRAAGESTDEFTWLLGLRAWF